MRKSIIPAMIATLVATATTPAHADMMSYLSFISSSTIGTPGQALALVNVHQNGADEVDVRVSLDSKTKFVLESGSHNAFAFSLNLATPYTETIINPGFTSESGSVTNTPYGTFTNGIACAICAHGTIDPQPGPLEFKITDISGISIANFVTNSAGYLFSADVLGPKGGSGNIASNALIPTPLPASLPMLGAGLLGMGIFARRKARTLTA